MERALRLPPSLVITADDFGLHRAVNEAVELASRAGSLSAASLMIGGAAAEDAIVRAKRLPGLRVGLHLTLLDGHSVLPYESVPLLVNRQRRFRGDLIGYSLRIAADRRLRAQLRAEIRAQFDAFARSGLTLDHVNTHKHFHMHPMILDMILAIGPDYGMRSLRVPQETWRCQGSALKSAFSALGHACLRILTARMKRRLTALGIRYCERIYGIRWSGAMNESRLLAIVGNLPEGNSEIYLHPATISGTALSPGMHGYNNVQELEALLSPKLSNLMERMNIVPTGYDDLSATDPCLR